MRSRGEGASDDNPDMPHKRGSLASFGNHSAAKPKPAISECVPAAGERNQPAIVLTRESLRMRSTLLPLTQNGWRESCH
jgi:hypothetical protein